MPPVSTLRKPAAAAKPALKKPALGKPAAKPATKTAAKATKPAKIKTPAKVVKPFENGEICVFKGYHEPPADGETRMFKPDDRVAVVGFREEAAVGEDNKPTGEKVGLVSVVPEHDYFKFLADENSVAGEEVSDIELRRTNKKAEQPYALVPVGDMSKLLAKTDPLEAAKQLYDNVGKSFFYLGGILAKLYRERDDEGRRNYLSYTKPDGTAYTDDKDGFEEFLIDNFTEEFGGARKANDLMHIYESISVLPNADEVIKQLPAIGWSKAVRMSSYITEENADALIETAKEQPIKQFEETLRTDYTTEGSTARGTAVRATISRTSFNFKLFEDRAEAVKYILEAAKKSTGVNDENALFEHIIIEWASDHLGDAAQKATAKAEAATKKLQKSGVKLPTGHPAAAKAVAKAA